MPTPYERYLGALERGRSRKGVFITPQAKAAFLTGVLPLTPLAKESVETLGAVKRIGDALKGDRKDISQRDTFRALLGSMLIGSGGGPSLSAPVGMVRKFRGPRAMLKTLRKAEPRALKPTGPNLKNLAQGENFKAFGETIEYTGRQEGISGDLFLFTAKSGPTAGGTFAASELSEKGLKEGYERILKTWGFVAHKDIK